MNRQPMQQMAKMPLWVAQALCRLAGAYVVQLEKAGARPPEVLASDHRVLELAMEAIAQGVASTDHLQPGLFYRRDQFFVAAPLGARMIIEAAADHPAAGQTVYFDESDWQLFICGDHGNSGMCKDEQFRREFAPANEKARHLLADSGGAGRVDDRPRP